MKIVIFTDPHITEDSFEELDSIFEEILDKSRECDMLLCAGDYYDKKRPTQKEIYFGTKWAHSFSTHFEECIMIDGNHTNLEDDFSNIDYLEFINWNCCKYFEKNNCFFGHFMTEKSMMMKREIDTNFSQYEKLLKDLNSYKISILGHQHCMQVLSDKDYHLGSCRFVSFSETEVKDKYIAIIDDTNYEEKTHLEFIKLDSVIPMYNITDMNKLSDLSKNSKVRVIFKDFETFKKNINRLEEYKNRFKVFKIKLDYKIIDTIKTEIKSERSISDIVNNWLNSIENEDVKKELVDEFKKGRVI